MPSCQQEVQAWFPWFCIHLHLVKTLYIETKHFLFTIKLKHWHYLVLQYTDTLRIPSPADVAATTFLSLSWSGLLVDIYIYRDQRPEVCNSDMVAILSV